MCSPLHRHAVRRLGRSSLREMGSAAGVAPIPGTLASRAPRGLGKDRGGIALHSWSGWRLVEALRNVAWEPFSGMARRCVDVWVWPHPGQVRRPNTVGSAAPWMGAGQARQGPAHWGLSFGWAQAQGNGSRLLDLRRTPG